MITRFPAVTTISVSVPVRTVEKLSAGMTCRCCVVNALREIPLWNTPFQYT